VGVAAVKLAFGAEGNVFSDDHAAAKNNNCKSHAWFQSEPPFPFRDHVRPCPYPHFPPQARFFFLSGTVSFTPFPIPHSPFPVLLVPVFLLLTQPSCSYLSLGRSRTRQKGLAGCLASCLASCLAGWLAGQATIQPSQKVGSQPLSWIAPFWLLAVFGCLYPSLQAISIDHCLFH
jgi:hypothetical protein